MFQGPSVRFHRVENWNVVKLNVETWESKVEGYSAAFDSIPITKMVKCGLRSTNWKFYVVPISLQLFEVLSVECWELGN